MVSLRVSATRKTDRAASLALKMIVMILNETMSVISRIMWTAETGELSKEAVIEAARQAINPWATEGSGTELRLNDAFTFERKGQNGIRTVSAYTVEEPHGLLVELEDEDRQGAIWGVQIRLAVQEQKLFAWIDNTLESETIETPISIGRPRVVDELLKVGNKPSLGTSAILNEPTEIPASGATLIHEILADENRGLPVVLVTRKKNAIDERAERNANGLAKRLTGLATVITLAPKAQDALKKELPQGLAVWGGAARVYAPTSLSSPLSHRVYSADLLERRGIEPIINWVTRMSSRRRPDRIVRSVDHNARKSDISAMASEIEKLTTERDEALEELEEQIIVYAEAEAELNKQLSLVRRLRKLAFENNQTTTVIEAEYNAENESSELTTVSEAIEQARLRLSETLTIPEGVERDLDRIDTAPSALAWANTTWRGLKALAAYAQDVNIGEYAGSFWTWCEKEGLWPASQKSLAMTESESIENNTKHTERRTFKVDTAVSPTGTIYMGAHLKVSRKGGSLAPRIYFYDDTNGPTKRVHIGFIGPHYLVPNSKS